MTLPVFPVVVTIAALIGGAAPLRAQTGPDARPPQADQTLAVTRGARLTVDNFGGEVIVRAWERDAVRVQARHAPRMRVSVKTVESGVAVSSSGRAPGSVDYEIDVPAWMPVKVNGHYAFIALEGTRGEVSAETVRGDIVIKGGTDFISARSVEGDVKVSGARGRISVSSINQGVSVEDSAGDIVAETVNGPIRLLKVASENVEATTVNGNVAFEGSPAARGRYRFATHNGNVVLTIPENASAVFSVRTYNGSLNSALPLQRSGEVGRGRRATYTLGAGAAEFDVESFGGNIQIRKPGSVAPPVKVREKDE
jgi:DUF4097 and DUF4098 domain-containing protein YvlB